MRKISKIISGGQTGVDQAALTAALALEIECGGWCPPGRACENGKIPDYFPLTETPKERSDDAPDIPRSLRTEWNVRDSDATLILKPASLADDEGTNWTIQCISKYYKDHLKTDPLEADSIDKIKTWLEKSSAQTLNIAGPSEKTWPGIGEQTFKILLQVFSD